MAPNTNATDNQKTIPTYRVRTMAGDLEAAKKGGLPAAAPVTLDIPVSQLKNQPLPTLPVEPKKSPSPKFEIPISPDGRSESFKIGFPELSAPTEPPAIKLKITPSPVPPLSEIKSTPSPIAPLPSPSKKPEPFSLPINKPFSPQSSNRSSAGEFDLSKKIMNQISPPPNLPTTPPAPPIPASRPLTPAPAAPRPLPSLPPLPTQARPIPTGQSLTPSGKTPPANLPPMEAFKAPKSKKLMILGIVAAALVLVFIIGEIWWFFLRQPASTAPSPANQDELLLPPTQQPLLPSSPTNTPAAITPAVSNLPAPILNYDRDEVVDSASTDPQDIAAAIKSFDVSSVGQDELVRLVVKIISPDNTAAGTDANTNSATITNNPSTASDYAGLDDIATGLGIKITTTIKNQLTGDYDLFIFGGSSFDKDECDKRKITAATCFGARMGLALKSADSVKLGSYVKAWEKTMASDLKPLILNKPTALTGAFLTGTYNGETIRYKNLPTPTTTIEYSLIGDALIIGTSKSSTLKAIDALPAGNNNILDTNNP